MNDILAKLKSEICKKIDGYDESLRKHEAHEKKLMSDLEKNRKAQETARELISVAVGELSELNKYMDSIK